MTNGYIGANATNIDIIINIIIIIMVLILLTTIWYTRRFFFLIKEIEKNSSLAGKQSNGMYLFKLMYTDLINFLDI